MIAFDTCCYDLQAAAIMLYTQVLVCLSVREIETGKRGGTQIAVYWTCLIYVCIMLKTPTLSNYRRRVSITV